MNLKAPLAWWMKSIPSGDARSGTFVKKLRKLSSTVLSLRVRDLVPQPPSSRFPQVLKTYVSTALEIPLEIS